VLLFRLWSMVSGGSLAALYLFGKY
jgi:hypothetical protein